MSLKRRSTAWCRAWTSLVSTRIVGPLVGFSTPRRINPKAASVAGLRPRKETDERLVIGTKSNAIRATKSFSCPSFASAPCKNSVCSSEKFYPGIRPPRFELVICHSISRSPLILLVLFVSLLVQ